MRLRSLRVRRLPGIDRDFELPDIAPGVNVVVGPNASGKSSVLRAVRALLYAEELKGAPVDIEGVFVDATGELRATRSGGAIAWSRNGRPAAAPALPAHHLLGCYTLRIEDLGGVDGTDAEIAHRVALELLGGYDLDQVRRDGPFRVKGSGRSQAERLRRTEERLRDVLNGRDQLLSDQARIDGWQRELENATAAADQAAAHERALALLDVRREIRALETRLAELPTGMERLTGNEAERLDALHARLEEQAVALAGATEARTEAQRALAASGLEQSTLAPADLAERRALLQEMHRL
ncbi:MAG: ATP-binding protein, partial [Deinococcales bacterium]